MRKYLLFCLAFCVLGCLAQDLIVRPNDPIIYKKRGRCLFYGWGYGLGVISCIG